MTQLLEVHESRQRRLGAVQTNVAPAQTDRDRAASGGTRQGQIKDVRLGHAGPAGPQGCCCERALRGRPALTTLCWCDPSSWRQGGNALTRSSGQPPVARPE